MRSKSVKELQMSLLEKLEEVKGDLLLSFEDDVELKIFKDEENKKKHWKECYKETFDFVTIEIEKLKEKIENF